MLWRPWPLMLAVACLVVGNFAFSPVSAQAKPGGKITIAAWTFDRGNARVSENPGLYGDYRDKHPELMLTGGDPLPWVLASPLRGNSQVTPPTEVIEVMASWEDSEVPSAMAASWSSKIPDAARRDPK